MKNIVIIGGGTGTSTLLEGLKKYPAKLSVIVSTADDGGSNARIRKDFNIIPPSDIRQCLLALSSASTDLKNLFSFRFARGELRGHTAGNIVFAAFYEIYGNIERALLATAELLKVQGDVIPVTTKATVLSAIYENSRKVVGEHNIDEVPVKDKAFRIKDVSLKPSGPANPRALLALKSADVIIFGPGDIYTSTIPNLLVKGIAQAINKSSAKKIVISNIMTKHGQSNGFKASDFVKAVSRYLGNSKIDIALINAKKPGALQLLTYKKHKSSFVEPNKQEIERLGTKVIAANLLSNGTFAKSKADILQRSFLRHDANKTAKIIWELIN